MENNLCILRAAVYQEAQALSNKVKIANVVRELFNPDMKLSSAVDSLRKKRIELSSASDGGSYFLKLKVAFNSLYKESYSPSFEPSINNAFYNEFNKRGIVFDSGFNFAGFMAGALRKLSPRMSRDTAEEIEQTILTKLFTAGEAGKSWFDNFKDRYAEDKSMENLLGKLKTTVVNLAKNWFRDEGKKTGPSYDEGRATPEQGGETDVPSEALNVPAEEGDIPELEAKNFAQSIEAEIENSPDTKRHADLLIAVFNKLLQGYSKGEISQDLGFKSQSRLNYYLDLLKDVVTSVAQRQGLSDLIPDLTKGVLSEEVDATAA